MSQQIHTNRLAICLLALLSVFVVQGLWFMAANSQTYDEAAHLAAGYSYLTRADFRLNSETPPFVKELCALPVYLRYRIPFDPDPKSWKIKQQFLIGKFLLYDSKVPADNLLLLARVPNLLMGLVLVALIGWWAYRLWGRNASLVSMALASFDPNLVAHSALVTVDVGLTLFLFSSIYLLWEYTSRPRLWLVVMVGASIGLALTSKFSAVILLEVLAIIFVVYVVFGDVWSRAENCKNGAPDRIGIRLIRVILSGPLIIGIAALVIAVTYLGDDPTSWWHGFQQQLEHRDQGHPAFLMGDHSWNGWWYYFPVAMLIKTPLGSLFLITLSLVLFRVGKRLQLREFMFLVIPPAVFLLAMTQARVNIGLRYVLPVYPFLFVCASRLACGEFMNTRKRVMLLGIPLVFTGASSLSVAPHQLAYFNELVGGPKRGHLYLGDSNLDWGQNLKGVKTFMENKGVPIIYLCYFGTASPAYYGIRSQEVPSHPPELSELTDALTVGPQPELLAISVTNIQGIYFRDKSRYYWLNSRRPIAVIGYSIYVFDLTWDAEAHWELAKVYVAHGFPILAKAELQRVLSLDPSHLEAKCLLGELQGR